MLALLIALLAPPAPVDVEADRLELTADGWRASGLVLQTGGARLSAATAEGHPTAACPQGALTLQGPITLVAPAARLDAADATLCLPGGALTAADARLDGPRLRGGAARLGWHDGALTAEDGWFSACGCDDPPWTISASAATIRPGEGAWAHWPVLRVGGVPIAAAPVAYVPLARRRTGLLLPTAGYDAEDGWWAKLPLFVALGPSLDLTLSPGWRDGFITDGRLRWAASARDRGHVEGGFAAPDEGFAAGRGTAPLGPLRVAVDGGWASDPEAWIARRPGYLDRSRATLTAEAGAAAAGEGLAVGIRGGRLDPLVGERPVVDVVPEVWSALGGAVGPLVVGFEALVGRYAIDGAAAEVYDLAVDAAAQHWLGPLRLRPVAGARTRIHPAGEGEDAGSGQRVAGFAAVEAELAVARRYGVGRHVIALTVDGRVADFAVEGAPPILEQRDRPVASRAVGAVLASRFIGRSWQAEASARVDYEARAPVEGFTAPWLRARVEGPVAGADLDVAGRDALLAGLWFAPAEGLRLDARWLRFEADPALPWLRPRGAVMPTQQAVDVAAVHGLGAGAALAVGALDLRWQGALDPARRQYVGQIGELGWRGRCECWSAGVWLGHEAGRPAPDVMLTVSLGPRG
ncbi:MAG: hypothetical protein R3F65_12795 [bacterium]